MNKYEKCTNWLWEHDCVLTELDGEPFAIVPTWSLSKTPGFEAILQTAGIKDWGFADEYDTCSECGVCIRTAPDSYHWQPDFWLTDNGYLCPKCIDPDEYLEYKSDHSQEVRSVNADIVNPENYGYVEVLSDREHGLHNYQNDDPRKVAAWAEENGLAVVFTIQPSQFYVTWDAWMAGENIDVKAIQNALKDGDRLKREFKQYPSPSDLCKAQLKEASKIGAKFCTVGKDGLKVYEDVDEMLA